MIHRITPIQVHCTKDGRFIAAASCLELRPGQWPQTIVIETVGVFDYAATERDREGDLEAVIYRTRDPRPSALHVLND